MGYEDKPVEVVGAKVGKTGGGQQRSYSVNQVAPKGTRKIATLTRIAGGQKTVISWQDAPDDLFLQSRRENEEDEETADGRCNPESSQKTIPKDFVNHRLDFDVPVLKARKES